MFHMSVAVEQIANVLGGRRVLGRQISTMRELDDLVRDGMPKQALDTFYAMALSVFEEPEAAARFMANPHPELDERAPFEAALTEIGGRRAEEVIERGLHGLPA